VRRAVGQGANSAGSLDEVNTAPTNSGGVKTSGIDTVLTWAGPKNVLGFLPGSINARVSYTHLISGYSVPLPGSSRDEFAGEIGAAKDRFTTTLGYDDDAFGFNVTGTYIGASYLDDQFTGAAPGTNAAYRVASEFYLDTQLRFKVQQRFEFYLGADNLLDNKPPYLADIGASAGQDTDAGTYDALGRRYYAGVRVKF